MTKKLHPMKLSEKHKKILFKSSKTKAARKKKSETMKRIWKEIKESS